MSNVFAAVVCSVLVSVLLKLAPRWRIELLQAIACNYLVAGIATALILRPTLAPLGSSAAAWPALVALGILLPTIFLVLAASVRSTGIVRSDVAQRLSLLLPLLAAFALFGETPAPLKLLGCTLGLVALPGMIWRSEADALVGTGWRWPLGVFFGFGVIDILFKQIARSGLPLGSSLQIVFALALVVATIIVLARRVRFDRRSLAAGIVLGLLNFGNIAFYLRAHRALPDAPSLVFAGMNLGVVALGALTGLWLFRERLSAINFAALSLAAVAVALIALG
ncbi:EamA/RhaT family transporter [Dokdonella sp.]|uniref:EamA/RhaT family transporter n=1 Tax=Dokdonella sp. TaxID=2291710 RepID=UPI0025BB9C29|nr:EamA/RhaT family transporter [Dokdonella sp.]MBX3689821.1 EamA/RhaT family transporter [Dokdonella sp.]